MPVHTLCACRCCPYLWLAQRGDRPLLAWKKRHCINKSEQTRVCVETAVGVTNHNT